MVSNNVGVRELKNPVSFHTLARRLEKCRDSTGGCAGCVCLEKCQNWWDSRVCEKADKKRGHNCKVVTWKILDKEFTQIQKEKTQGGDGNDIIPLYK